MNNPKPTYRIGIDARMMRSSIGGIGRYSRELLVHLANIDKHNQYVVFITPEDLIEWPINQPNFEPAIVPIYHYSLSEQMKLCWEMTKRNLDLVHFLNFNHPLLYGRKFITTLHDLTLFHYPGGRSKDSRIRRFAFTTIFKHAYFRAKKVIAISEFSADDACKTLGLSHAKMEVVYEGGPSQINPEFGGKASLQKWLGYKQPYFLFVSQWRSHKGLITLVKAFDIFKDKTGLPHKLVLVGNQEAATEEIKDALVGAKYASDIIALGFVDDEHLIGLYHFATAFVMPSEYEGFGLPILEAFSCQAPVISSDSTCLPEVVGQGGLLFKNKNEVDLSEKMTIVASNEDLRVKLIAAGLNQLGNFSWDEMAKKTLDIYLRVLNK